MAAEVVTLTDGTNTVDFLDGTYIYQDIQGLDPPGVAVIYAGDRPVHRQWENREITLAFGINATTAVELEQKKRTFITILENTYLYFVSQGLLSRFWKILIYILFRRGYSALRRNFNTEKKEQPI